MPYETNFSGLSLDEANAKYALKSGSDTQTFNCDVLNCNSIASRNNADIGMTTTSLIGNHLYYKTIPNVRTPPTDTTSVSEKFALVDADLAKKNNLLPGVCVNWMSAAEQFVRFTGSFLPGAPGFILPANIKLLKLTMKYYNGQAAINLPGLTTCTVALCKHTVTQNNNNDEALALTVTKVADLFTFDSTLSNYPSITVDMSTLNSGSPYELLANETLILRFKRSIAIGGEPSDNVKNAEIQCCLHYQFS